MHNKLSFVFLVISLIPVFWCLQGCTRTGEITYASIEYADSTVTEESVCTMTVAEQSDGPEKGSGEEVSPGLYVAVLGNVENPGIYVLPAGSRVYEAINAAGGMLELSDAEDIDLVAVIDNDMQIVVGNGTGEKNEGVSETSEGNGKININTASETELLQLTGIGPSKALAIIEYRNENGNFTAIEDIMKVSGIKEGTFEKIKEDIAVR